MNSSLQFDNFYWIGGAACGGKTTVTTALANKHQLLLYKCDEHAARRKKNSSPERTPMLFSLPVRTLDEVLINIPLEQQVEEYKQFLIEDFYLVMEDLQAWAKEVPVIVEGNHLMPHLLPQYIADTSKAIWITPTKQFYNKNFFNRKWILEKVKESSNPAGLEKLDYAKRIIYAVDRRNRASEQFNAF